MKSQNSIKSGNRTSVSATIAMWTITIVVFITAIYWRNVKSFFATTPQAKCEALVESNSKKDTYCTISGERRSHSADAIAKEKKECLSKSPYFEWSERPSGLCKRVRYESREACIDDGKQGTRTIQLPGEDGGGSESVSTRCLEDGTWEAYDPEYESYRQQRIMEVNRTSCIDVTSNDRNWDNDMLCTRPDGSKFYTSYSGAKGY